MLPRTSLTLLLLSVCTSLFAQDITTDLEAYWTFDETSGNTAADSSGNGNTGTAVNHSWVPTGRVGGCIELDGSFDYVSVANSASLQIDGVVTISAWVKADTVSSYHCIVGHGSTSSAVSNTFLYAWSGDWLGGSHSGGNDEWANANVPGGDIGNWTHVAIVFTGSQWRLYRNGVLLSSHNTSQGAQNQSGGRWAIGATNSLNDRFFDGQIDEVRIYSRALSDADIAAVYAYEGESLIAHWKLDEGSGTTAADASGKGNDARFDDGTPTWVTGVRGYALEFGGTSDLQTYASFDPPAIGSVAFWFRSNATPTATERLIGTYDDWEVYTGADGVIYCDLDGGGTGGNFNTGSAALTTGRWRHLVAIYNSITDTYQLYLDGELLSSGAFDCEDPSSGVLGIGVRQATVDRFNGAMDDIRVYNYELTATEVAELYGLIGHWKLDETSGTTAADSSLIANDATLHNGSTPGAEGPYPGEGEHAVELDGVNDQVVAPHHDAYNPDEALSIALWVQRQEVDWWDTLVSKGKYGNPPYIFAFTEGGGLTFKTDITNVVASGTVPENEWTHLVVTFDESEVNFYVNGQLDSTRTLVAELTTDSTLNMNIGSGEFSDGYANVRLHDVRIYNRVLTTREIAEIYGLVGWWRMEETSGSLVSDSSGAGNHGTINGTSAWSSDAKEGAGSIDLDGTNHVEIPSLILTEGSATVAGWARLTDNDTNGSELITLGNHFGIRIDSTLSGQGSYGYAYNGSSWDDVKPNYYHEGTGWHHFVMVADDVNLERRFYIDGVLEETLPASGPLVMSGQNSSILIGTRGTSLYDFTGQIDDVRVYNRAINPTEIEVLYFGDQAFGPRIVRWLEVANP